jgi:hypothetical protein
MRIDEAFERRWKAIYPKAAYHHDLGEAGLRDRL